METEQTEQQVTEQTKIRAKGNLIMRVKWFDIQIFLTKKHVYFQLL